MVKREGNKYNFSLYNWLYLLSHLAWVRGLKYIFFNSKIYLFYRTSLGGVD